VLITLYKLEATTDGTTWQTLYDEANGQTIDLPTLRNSALLLASVSAPTADYTRLRVTFNKNITVTPTGGGASQHLPCDPTTGATSGEKIVIEIPAVSIHGNQAAMVLDFDLAGFQLVGGKVRPSIKHSDMANFASRERECRIPGVVANLSASGFDLQVPRGQAFHVTLTTDTVVVDKEGATATLANGQNVLVEGQPDRDTRTIAADTIRVMPPRAEPPADAALAAGKVKSVAADGKSLTLEVAHVRGFEPPSGTLTVALNEDTKIRKGREAGTVADLTVDKEVSIGGTYDAGTQTLTAKFIHLHPARPGGGGPH
jgi:hypothetical protein